MANLIISNGCNAACDYCFASSFLQNSITVSKTPFMSIEEYGTYLDFLDRSGIDDVRLLGGEPTLHPRFAEMIDLGKRKRKHITVFTNGVSPDSAISALMKLSPDECTIIVNMNAKINSDQAMRRENVFHQLGQRVIAGYTISSPVFSLENLIRSIGKFNLKRIIRLGIALPIYGKKNRFLHPKQYRMVGHSLAEQSFQTADKGILIEPDCGFVRCMFSEEDFYRLEENRFHYISCCSPVLDFCTGGEILHCFSVSEKFRTIFSGQPDINEIRRNFTVRTEPWRKTGIYPECASCSFRQNGECCGGCLSAVMRRFIPVRNREEE